MDSLDDPPAMRRHGALLWIGALLSIALFLLGACTPATSQPAKAALLPGAQTLQVDIGDFFIKPASISVKPGTDVTLQVTNKGAIEHNLTVQGGVTTGPIKPGQQASLHVGTVSAQVNLLCNIPGHADAGMKGMIMLSADASAPGTVSDSHVMTSAEMDASYLAGVKAFPAKTQGVGNQPLAPVVQDGVKVFELTASEIDWEVSPGNVRKAMAYNGQVPGPVIRVNLGDRVRVVLHNKLNESTALHFHGLQVPNAMDGLPGITQPLVKPGESFTYEFTVKNGGTNMYHSHMNGEVQITSGLLGAFIVDSPADPPAAHEQIMVLNDGPLGYTLNGKGFPATEPIVAKLGETVRIRYMNEGLQIHPMHLHGLVQTVIAKDGYLLDHPYKADTVLVGPGERYDVLVQADALGAWAYHCHILTHAEAPDGMFGMVTAFIVQQ